MAILDIDTTLDIIEKQKELAAAITGEDSIYIKMKETLVDLLDKGEIKSGDRAKIVGDTISAMAINITNTSMSTALAWQAQEKELALKKEELKIRLDLLKNEVDKAEEEARLAKESVRLAQAKRIREYGKATFDPDGNVIALSNEGLIYEQQQLVKKQIEQGSATISKIQDDLLTAAKQRLVIEKQVEQVSATIAKLEDDLLTAAEQRLSIEMQTQLYERQKEGFDDNKRQKLFEAQMNAWALAFSSGLLTTKPDIISNQSATALYDALKP